MHRPMYVLFAIASLTACGGGGDSPGTTNPPPPAPAPVASVTVTPDAVQLLPQATSQLSATTKDANGNTLTGRSVTWGSNAPSVASVSTSGLVTSLSDGSAIITATSEGQNGSAAITVLPPVASVALDKSTATLVPSQTLQLSASTKDGSGNTLSNRTTAWTTSAATIATVSSAGLVTAMATGSATITATSEGKSATSAISVADGAVVGSAGGSVVAAGGAVKLDVPAGAAPAGTVFTVEKVAEPAPHPAAAEPLSTAFYKLTPEGAQFSSPVTVTVRYDPVDLHWAAPEDLTIVRWDGSKWNQLSNIVVDSVAHTVSGQTTGFSTIGPARRYPTSYITPDPAQVNAQKRSITLTARTLNQNLNNRNYVLVWKTTGVNGTLNSQFQNTIQYTETAANLPSGVIDQVTVELMAPATWGLPYLLSKTTIDITSNLQYFVTLNPPGAAVKFQRIIPFDVEIRDLNGNLYTNPGRISYLWQNTAFSGKWSVPNGWTNQPSNTYSAVAPNQAAPTPPRGDRISVDVLEDQVIWDFKVFPPTFTTKTVTIGKVLEFVDVGNDQWVGQFSTHTVPTPNGGCVYADVLMPKVTPASLYLVRLDGFNDPLQYGKSFAFQFTGATGTGIGKVEDIGTQWRYSLDGGCVSAAGIPARIQIYNSRFAGMRVEVNVTP